MEIKVEMQIWELREERKLSIGQLSVKANISKSQLCEIENNKAIPRLDTLLKISKALNVDIKETYKATFYD